jgi:hypothetical protein
VTTSDHQRLDAALEDYAARHRFSLAFRDPPLVPPQSRSYELRADDARIRVFNPFDPSVFFVTIFANDARAQEVCRTLLSALASQGFAPGPAADFRNPPPRCPSM